MHSEEPQVRPAPLVAAAGLTAVQGLVTTLYGIVEIFSVAGDRVVMGVTTAFFFAVYGVALIFCAWGMNRLRPWSRGPVLFAELIWLLVAWSFRGGNTLVFAIVLAVSAALVLAGLLHPASVAALNRPEHLEQHPDEDPDAHHDPE
jgi:peptidoglycan/LPS O-acetylase OafA/YrhL